MNSIVVIKVIPNVLKCEVTVIVIGMMAFCQSLVQSWIKVPEEPSSIGRPVLKHNEDKAEVNQSYHNNYSPEPLHGMEEIQGIRLQVGKGAQKKYHRVDSSPPIGIQNGVCLFFIFRQGLEIFMIRYKCLIPNNSKREKKHHLDVIRHIRDEW